MQFEIGKHYKTRGGKKATCLWHIPGSQYSWFFGTEDLAMSVTESGLCYWNTHSVLDIIGEWEDPPPKKYRPIRFPDEAEQWLGVKGRNSDGSLFMVTHITCQLSCDLLFENAVQLNGEPFGVEVTGG